MDEGPRQGAKTRPGTFPWFWKNGAFTGDRINDMHLTNAQKRAAQDKAGMGKAGHGHVGPRSWPYGGYQMIIKWQDFIEERKEVMMGKPVFKGTRLTVEHVLHSWVRDEP